jgi:CRISPR-associated Cas5-like protein
VLRDDETILARSFLDQLLRPIMQLPNGNRFHASIIGHQRLNSSQQKELTMTIHLRTWGDLACFTRPEMKVERVSYPVITPSAALLGV